ncbi:MbcA/ParS/Xre antitoxin family protein [Bradyrhizobium sp. CCGUVB1N3]|uniref:antitoxin Xre/MbcA/ParS toxin-binding domain-containing protein n=1 Tax=Bradyrhizobium sp. CCGUVB1N3 TaxID=2949629 RepID=UPI0020B32337|nr:antitoxin Xre/MbcA/ParS toxin-binding domain-containing protein [Bradyrhizobium sp. CCGUVB1N3]MCP3471798.1 MbcA/ParS/Xre antitoxin family protein [Bradyrhizobium sp. CCGUVB1N3]MCP3473580.1 MbcA/ParS/Xre antitoxin family protein [Bradyrhizobium sp. CCGUVB1N3]
MTAVAVTDPGSGRRLTGSTTASATQMVAVLIEDHRERAEADPVDPSLAEEKRSRREKITSVAVSVFGDETIARAWLTRPHCDFDDRRPLAVAARDDCGLAAVTAKLASLDAHPHVEAPPARTVRTLYAEALDVLLRGEMADVAVARDWDLLSEVARLAFDDASTDLAVTDPSLFAAWREAVTKFHLKGWTNMTPQRVEEVRKRAAERAAERQRRDAATLR